MAQTMLRPMTADEFLNFVHLPKNLGRSLELDRGSVVESFDRDEVAQEVGRRLLYRFGLSTVSPTQGAGFVDDGRLVIERKPDTVCKPFLAYFAKVPNCVDVPRDYPPGMPDLVVEILCSKQRFSSLTRRLNRFIDAGVGTVWLVNPGEKAVTTWRRGKSPEVYLDDEVIAQLPYLPEFRCKISELFTDAATET